MLSQQLELASGLAEGFVKQREDGKWCVHNEPTKLIIKTKAGPRCYPSRDEALQTWYKLDCHYTKRWCDKIKSESLSGQLASSMENGTGHVRHESAATPATKATARHVQATLEKTASSVLSYAIPDALGKIDLGKHLRSVAVPSEPRGHFSDGKELEPESRDLGYAFTIRYPTKAVTTFSFEVDLQPAELEHSIRMELDDDDGISSEQIQEILKGIDIADMFKAATATSAFDEALREPSDVIRTSIEEKAEVQQSTEAYSHDGPVKMAEYPAVHLRWDVQPAKQELKTQGSGFRHKAVLKVEWTIKPDGWAFESDLRRRPNGWNRLRL